MLEGKDQLLSELFSRFNTILQTEPVVSDPERFSHFQETEEVYNEIQNTIALELEDLKNLSTLLDSSLSKSENRSCWFLKNAVTKKYQDKSNYSRIKMNQAFSDFYYRKGVFLFEQQHIEPAYKCWEKALLSEPTNASIKSRLLETGGLGKELQLRADELLRTFKLEYVASFGRGLFSKPLNLLASRSEQSIFVSDADDNRICRFSPEGLHLGSIDAQLLNPQGMFQDKDENLWVCDFGNSRMVSLATSGDLLHEVKIQDIVADGLTTMHPVHGCANERQFFLIVKSKNLLQSGIIAFDKGLLPHSAKFLRLDNIKNPRFIRLYRDELYVAESDPARLHIFDISGEHPRTIRKLSFPSPLQGFVKVDEHLFVNAGEFLFKVSAEGGLIFAADIRALSGLRSAIHSCADSLTKDGRTMLFMLDASQFCLHKLYV